MPFGKKTVLTALFFCVAGIMTASAAPDRLFLPGHVPPVVRRLSPVGTLPGTNQLRLAIGLPLRNPKELDELLRQLADPASPNFRRYLTPEAFTARFGPTEADYALVEEFARTNGLVITATHANRLLLDVAGPVTAVEKAFHIMLRTYRHPTEARNFFAPDTEPSVDAALPVVDIQGLSDFSRPHPKLVRRSVVGVAPKSGSAPDGFSYFGNDFRTAYVPGTALNGAGQTVGLVQFDGFYSNDIAAYAAAAGGGRTNILLQTVLIDGFSGTPTTGANSGNDEVSLDIEMAMSMAPALAQIVLFEGNPNNFIPNDVLNAMAASNTVKNLSSSWGWSGGPTTTTDNIFKTMAAQGQSYFNATGDSDAFPAGYVDNSGNSTVPSSSPYITQVGGTMLATAGAGGPYSSETVWNRNNGVGTSGGISTYYSIPSWQQGINSFLSNGGSPTARNIPDVALTAEYVYVMYGNGTNGSFGGTSCAAPLWAGFMALVNQQAAASAQPSAGFINPAIYELANESIYNAVFHDTTVGNNTSSASPNAFYAGPNYDLCTGVGSPNGTNLINALLNPDPLVVVSNAGFNAVGSPAGNFNVAAQTFYLTNVSAFPLTWSLGNAPAWLNVSASGGTLAAGAGSAVVVGLNTVASNLLAGTYTASLWFTNVTSGVAHSRFFTLTVSDSLVILPTNNFSFFGLSGGPFAPAAQGIILTNARAGVLNWSLNNTSVWFNVSPAGGSLAGDAQTNVTFTLTSAVTNLANGTYTAVFQVTNLASQFVQSVTGSVSISSSLVQNGGFETGDFTDWTLNDSGNGSDFVDNGTYITPHSGSYYAALGQAGAYAYLSQTLPTTPGQKYLLSFWLYNRVAGSFGNTEKFKANWNTNTLYNLSNPSAFGWTNLYFVVTATGTSNLLQFAVRNDPDIFGLDDVSVTPGFAPAISTQPTNLTVLSGGNAVFNALATGSTNLVYQWRKNGVNFANGAGISGATSNVLTLTAVTTNSSGNYSLFVTNIFGAATSSVAVLTVVLSPSITASSLTNRTVQCGANTNIFTITAAGTAPLFIQWSTNNVPVIGATNVSFALTNLHLATVTNVAVAVTNPYGGVTNSAGVTVIDTLAPTIALNGANPLYVELGSTFTDPGATASDACAGSLAVAVSGTVNTNSVSTNTVFYTASDGGNSATNSRTVIVRDTTPPTILWSFTNLIVAANSNCVALLPNVTGTNFILATDLSGALTVTQTPTNNFPLPLGTNTVVIAVADASGNTAFSTNTVVVQDQTPPVIFSQPQSQTNFIGTTATFSVAATACTPLTFQWYSNNVALAIFTNTTLALSNLTVSAAANYFVVASANGGATTSSVATLTVNLIPPAINNVAANANGSFNLNLTGSPGYIYILQATTNLLPPVNWLPLATNTLGTNGVWLFTDTSATNFPLQFYRLKLGP